MVYCTKCGTKNEEDAKYCVKCGATLKMAREQMVEERAKEFGEELGRRAEAWGEEFGKQMEQECFGLPHGGTIIGLIIGAVIILVGLSVLAGGDWGKYLGPFMMVVFGILIVAGALYGYRRRS
jgi:uncharacterized membrane protein YvbJ